MAPIYQWNNVDEKKIKTDICCDLRLSRFWQVGKKPENNLKRIQCCFIEWLTLFMDVEQWTTLCDQGDVLLARSLTAWLVDLQRRFVTIRCCTKNRSSVTPVTDDFLCYLQCCNALQAFESDFKTYKCSMSANSCEKHALRNGVANRPV